MVSWQHWYYLVFCISAYISVFQSSSNSYDIGDVNVHRILCGWLSRQYKTFISQTAILPVDLTLGDKYHWGENYTAQTRIKELILLLEIFLSLKIQDLYVHYLF